MLQTLTLKPEDCQKLTGAFWFQIYNMFWCQTGVPNSNCYKCYVFWDVRPCSLVDMYQNTRRHIPEEVIFYAIEVYPF